MSIPKAGGRAFPRPCGETQNFENEAQTGMSLRAWLAGQALTGYLASYSSPDVLLPSNEQAARHCVEYADAVIAELAESYQPAPEVVPTPPTETEIVTPSDDPMDSPTCTDKINGVVCGKPAICRISDNRYIGICEQCLPF